MSNFTLTITTGNAAFADGNWCTVQGGVGGAASELTKRWIEKRLEEDLAYKGQDWFEYEVEPSLQRPEWVTLYRVAAESAVSRLWPGAA